MDDVLPTCPGELASRIENYWRLKDCGRRDGKSPFDLLVEDIERIQADSYRRGWNAAMSGGEQPK